MIDEALLRVLSAHTGRRERFTREPTRMTGGFWAAIYEFELATPPGPSTAALNGPLVLRVMPNPDAGVREATVQRLVAEQGYPTPHVLLDGFDLELGGAFMVMERVDGAAPLGDLGLGRALLGVPRTLRRLPRQLATVSVDLHRLDPQPIVAALGSSGIDVSGLGVAAHLDEIGRVAGMSTAGLDRVLQWLDRHRPALTPAVICHGDIHPFNLLVTDDGSFNLLDWTNANLCRAEYDVGFTAALLRCAPITVPRIAQWPIAAITRALADRFVSAYAAMAGPLDLDAVKWFEVLQCSRCLAAVVNSRLGDDGIVGRKHPFQVSAPAMIRRVRAIADVKIELPDPLPG